MCMVVLNAYHFNLGKWAFVLSLNLLMCFTLQGRLGFTSIPVTLCASPLFGGWELHLWHMEVPWLGVELELHLLATATGTAMPDPSRICDLHCSSQQCQVLNPLSRDRDQTCILMDTGQVHYHWAMTGTPCHILDSIYKWYHMVFAFLFVSFFT